MDCHEFANANAGLTSKSRNDAVGRFVIARLDEVKAWQSAPTPSLRDFCKKSKQSKMRDFKINVDCSIFNALMTALGDNRPKIMDFWLMDS